MAFPVLGRFQRMPRHAASACVAMARHHPLHRPAVHYPDWYLHRWHLLPEGYLSERSVRMYDRFVRPLYWVLAEGPVLREVVRELSANPPGDLLELGSGTGQALVAFREALPGCRVRGMDLSPYMVEVAQRRVPGVEVLHADATAPSLDPASCDVVFAAHLPGHLPAHAAEAVMREAASTLRPGGRLVLVEHPWHRPPLDGWREEHRSTRALGLLRVFTLRPVEDGTRTTLAG
jgi:SAM-dependent methyltransferase